MQKLIRYTSENKLASEKQVFTSFVELLTEANPSISSREFGLMKRCIDEDGITPQELEYGFIQAYKDPERYGKVEWNHIWKHILIKRDHDTPKGFEILRKYGSG